MQTGFQISHILTDPRRQWQAIRKAAQGNVRTAFRALDVDWKKYTTDEYLFTHDTACCSVATEENGYWIKPACWELVNANGNAWTNTVLLGSYKTFVGGDNFCFPKGTRVLMADGTYKPIEEIQVGDRVINAKGEVDIVSDTFCHPYTGKTVTVKHPSILSKELTSTADHPFFVYQDRETSIVSGKKLKPQRMREHPRYDDVGLASGEHKDDATESRWGHPQYVNSSDLNEERNLLIHPIPGTIIENEEVNENRAFLIGWFLAEGSYVDGIHGISFSLSTDEQDIAEKISQLLEMEFPEKCLRGIVNAKDKEAFVSNAPFKHAKITVGKHPKTGKDSWLVLNYYSSNANAFFRKWCNEYSWAKCLPEEAMALPFELQKIILMQYMCGDGCNTIKSKGAMVTSKSQKLIQQMRFIAIRLGTFPTYREIGVIPRYTQEILKDGYPVFIDPSTGKLSRPGYELDFNSNDWHKLSNEKEFKHGSRSVQFENNFVFRFKKSENEVQDLIVYNFETQNDHSYVAEGVAVHNCEHMQLPSLSKGKILDAIIRPVHHHSEKQNADADIYYVDVLVATNRKHAALVEKIESGKLSTLSMGTICNGTTCSICGKKIYDGDKNCEHLDRHLGKMVKCSDGKERICAELCGCVNNDGSYEEGTNSFIEISWVSHPAFEGSVLNSFIETPAVKKAREQDRDELSKLFESNLFERLKVADVESRVALRITNDETRPDRIANRIFED